METKIKGILATLNESHCPFAGDGKDQWLSEVLFSQSFERYQIMEWILEQLGINISEISQNKNTVESKIQDLAEALSAIGVCSTDDTDIIEGTASKTKQVTFWNFLCCFLSQRNYLGQSSFESGDSNDSDSDKLTTKYEQCTEYISKVCENVNLIDAFDKELQLFPAHLSKEMKEFFKKGDDQEVQYLPECLSNDLKQFLEKSDGSLTSEEIRKNYFEKFGVPKLNADISSYLDIQQKNLEVEEFEDKIIPEEAALSNAEESIAVSLKNLENSASGFENAYDNLKPFISDVKPQHFIDIGPAFKATNDKLNSVLKLKNSANSLKTSDSELEVLKSDVDSVSTSSGCLSNDKLEEYLGILSLTEKR